MNHSGLSNFSNKILLRFFIVSLLALSQSLLVSPAFATTQKFQKKRTFTHYSDPGSTVGCNSGAANSQPMTEEVFSKLVGEQMLASGGSKASKDANYLAIFTNHKSKDITLPKINFAELDLDDEDVIIENVLKVVDSVLSSPKLDPKDLHLYVGQAQNFAHRFGTHRASVRKNFENEHARFQQAEQEQIKSGGNVVYKTVFENIPRENLDLVESSLIYAMRRVSKVIFNSNLGTSLGKNYDQFKQIIAKLKPKIDELLVRKGLKQNPYKKPRLSIDPSIEASPMSKGPDYRNGIYLITVADPQYQINFSKINMNGKKLSKDDLESKIKINNHARLANLLAKDFEQGKVKIYIGMFSNGLDKRLLTHNRALLSDSSQSLSLKYLEIEEAAKEKGHKAVLHVLAHNTDESNPDLVNHLLGIETLYIQLLGGVGAAGVNGTGGSSKHLKTLTGGEPLQTVIGKMHSAQQSLDEMYRRAGDELEKILATPKKPPRKSTSGIPQAGKQIQPSALFSPDGK